MQDDLKPDNLPAKGAYVRDATYINDRVVADVPAGSDPQGETVGEMRWPVEAGRYRLAAARACPWAHRSVITRRLLGLDKVISLGLAGPTHDKNSWTFDLDPGGKDPVLGIERLQQAYFARIPDYPRGITVPALVDIPSGAVVTNAFSKMNTDFVNEWTQFHREGAPDLLPEEHLDEIAELDARIYRNFNNGVYRAGFAADQENYEEAYKDVFDTLDFLEERLSTRRYLVGDHITAADIRTYTTLVRFDAVYHGHFKVNRNKITEMPALWGYLRDLYQTPGFGDTTDFVQIKQHYYIVHHEINPRGVVAAGPALANLRSAHHREELGGSPFGDGTAPGPVPAGEEVPADHQAV